ncbi:MAG TPA: hypothetical protein VN775_13160 [Opitutaceae bacterium]|nr:hypothetical protein [Opitutaceae bacterium]
MSGKAKACLLLGGVLALVALAWMMLLPAVVEHELRAVTGFEFRVAVLTANPFSGRVVVRGLVANNPPGYPAPDFVELRELRSAVEVFSWIFSDRIVIDDLDLDVGTIVLMRRHDGRTNAGDFMAAFAAGGTGPPAAAPAPAPRKPTRYLVKNLRLRLDRLVVADYSGAQPDEKTYQLHIDQTCSDVTDPRQLLVPGVVRSLHGFLLRHDVGRLLPGDLGSALSAAVGGAEHIGSDVKGAGKKTGEYLKGLLDKLEQSPKQ